MALATQLQETDVQFQQNAPKRVVDTILSARSAISNQWNTFKPLNVGEKLPPFTLPNAIGEQVSSTTFLEKGPLIITFYRGEWCPFCNLALGALQKHIDAIHARGAELVAISPELPNTSLTTVEKHTLRFPVLTDLNLEFARKLGIVWEQPENMGEVFEEIGIEIEKRTGRASLEVPVPATFLVSGDGVVVKVSADPDYTKRVEPETVLEWLDELKRDEN